MDLIEELKKFDIENISDALNCLNIYSNINNFYYTVEDEMIIGPAYTVEFTTDNDKNNCIAANYIDNVPSNSVIVIDNHNIDYCTVWGNILSTMAQIKDIKGTIINGAMRDYKKSKEYKYPVYSKSINCKTGKGIVKLKSIGDPIVIDNITINPGDYIVAQNSIVLVIPNDKLEDVIRISKEIESAERKILDAIKKGTSLEKARMMYKYDSFK